jgi:hypothetical protein
MKLSLPPKLVGKLVWVPVMSFCKIIIPSYTFDALLCRNCPISPPNRLTLQITLVSKMDQSEEVMNLCSTHTHTRTNNEVFYTLTWSAVFRVSSTRTNALKQATVSDETKSWPQLGSSWVLVRTFGFGLKKKIRMVSVVVPIYLFI